MNIFKQICKDGKTLLIGQSLLSDSVTDALTELRSMQFTDEMDLLCIVNCLDYWDDMTEQDQQIVYCVMANVYSDLVEDVDQFIDDCEIEGVNIGYCEDSDTYIPTSMTTDTLENTFTKVGV